MTPEQKAHILALVQDVAVSHTAANHMEAKKADDDRLERATKALEDALDVFLTQE